MNPVQKTILFSLRYAGRVYPIQVMPNQYYSLMTLIADQLAIPGFGLCCGMGSCATCLVQITDPYNKQSNIVLSCDIRVNDSLANVEIIISDTRF
jgi:aerobic-type carbon monoxide dehydrogenase small subunit (CoxS/CutS family)